MIYNLVYVCVLCMCATCMSGVQGGQKTTLNPLELKLRTVVSCVGVGNQTWVPCKTSRFS